MSSKKLNLVVATCSNRGIGVNGTLPWRIRGDMAFFKRITMETKDADKQNAVIMGRKTWESIPSKFRPLAKRVNIIISRTMSESPEGAHVVRGLDEAIELATSEPLANQVEGLFIIGGSSIYEMALNSPHCYRIYLTQVLADYQCDTFLPKFDTELFKQTEVEGVDGQMQTEKDISYKFEVYQKAVTMESKGPTVNIIAAMMDNRGIGKDGQLPWPHIKKDFNFYTRLVTTPKQQGKICMHIKGRLTYVDGCNREGYLPNSETIVVSRTMKTCPDQAQYLAHNYEEAIALASSPPLCEKVDQIWVMGGANIYQAALNSPRTHRLYLTRIYLQLESDTFFPEITGYQRVSDPLVEEGIHEENGVKLEFEVYERIQEPTASLQNLAIDTGTGH